MCGTAVSRGHEAFCVRLRGGAPDAQSVPVDEKYGGGPCGQSGGECGAALHRLSPEVVAAARHAAAVQHEFNAMLVSGGAEAERGLVVYLRCKMLAEMEVRKLIEGGTNGAQGDASAAVPGRGKATPTAAQQQDEGRGWSWGRDPEPVHPARCRAGEPQGDTGDTEAAAGMGSTPVMAAWHGTRSQLRRAQREAKGTGSEGGGAHGAGSASGTGGEDKARSGGKG